MAKFTVIHNPSNEMLQLQNVGLSSKQVEPKIIVQEKIVEVPFEVVKEIEKVVQVETIKEVSQEVIKEKIIQVIPKWIWAVLAVEAAIIAFLLIK